MKTLNDRVVLPLGAAITVCALLLGPKAHAAPPPQAKDIVAFCRANGTLDHPEAAFFGKGADPGAIPDQVSGVDGANKWRCLDGQVLLCSDSADGDWCSKKDASRIPSATLREHCADNPSAAEIPFYAGHYSAFDWRCKGKIPVIAKAYTLDRRGFFKASWVRYVVRGGVVIAPKEMPDGPR